MLYHNTRVNKHSGILIGFLLSVFAIPIFSQSSPCDDLSRRDKRNIERVKTHNKEKDYIRALRDVIPVFEDHPDCPEVQYLHGYINYNLNDTEKAERSFRIAYKAEPDVEPYLSYTLGKIYYDKRSYNKAIEPLTYFIENYSDDKYVKYAEKYLKLSQIRLKILADSLVNFNPFKLSDNINTDAHEYLPALSADNKSILFTRRYGGQEDIFMSRRNKKGKWKKAQPLNDINTRSGNEGGHCFSADGRTLIFTSCSRKKSYGSCDLMISFRRSNGRWSTPKNMGPSINTSAWESQPCLSPDKRYLYFSSNRETKKSDIYYATLQPDGTYGDVKSIGKPINTDGNERAPFIAFDNETLYFASDGHPTLGKRDIFISRKDSSGKWQKPKNLGPPLNSAADDGAFFVNSNATLAYFSTDKDGSVNIYAFEPDSSISPRAVTYIEGTVYDKKTEEPLIAEVSVMRLRDSSIVSKFLTNGDGYYLSCLPVGETYAFWVDKKGYLFHSSRHTVLDTSAMINPQRIDIPLQSIQNLEENSSITLRNVLYETASSKLLPEAKPELNKLLNFMKENPEIKIRIEGHTDNVGSSQSNLILSRDRAASVKNYLKKHGIDKSRLSSKGFGESQPIVPNNSEENRALNRRTEIVIK